VGKCELWIGVAHVRKLEGCELLENSTGAYTNIITWASNEDEYRSKVELIASKLRLFVLEVEATEPVSQRKRKFQLDEELEELVESAERNPNAILYGTFYTYPKDDA
jgi:hypothetical protein